MNNNATRKSNQSFKTTKMVKISKVQICKSMRKNHKPCEKVTNTAKKSHKLRKNTNTMKKLHEREKITKI